MRSKGNVSALLFMSCFGVVYFKVDVFRKEYNNVNFMGNDLERRLYDTKEVKLKNSKCMLYLMKRQFWSQSAVRSLHFILTGLV